MLNVPPVDTNAPSADLDPVQDQVVGLGGAEELDGHHVLQVGAGDDRSYLESGTGAPFGQFLGHAQADTAVSTGDECDFTG